MKNLENLCALSAVSGEESPVRDYVISLLVDTPYFVDNLGNLIVEKKGAAKPKNKLMFSAHMDEVGVIITHIDDNGFLSFSTVGGINPKALLGKRVKINGLLGVIGTSPVHLSDDTDELPKISEMYIDIGAKNKDQAKEYVSLGDCGTFESDFVRFGEGYIKSKAIDDRFGCSVLLDLISKSLPYDVTFCFCVMEEIGLKGSGSAASRIKPDIAVILESTTANDVCGVSGADKVCSLSEGAVVSFMDGATLYDKALYKEAMALAADMGVKAQTKTRIAGGNDAAAIQSAGEGARVLALSVPTRYIHSSSCVALEEDIESTAALAESLIARFGDID